MTMKIRLLGVPAIVDAAGEPRAVRGLQAWALLARILTSERPLSRRELAAALFPETVDPLGSLRWCLASLRKALDCAQALLGDPIDRNLGAGTVVDLDRLDQADFDFEAAGGLLEGIDPRCSPEFATWLLLERERVAGLIDARIRQETQQSISVGHYARAIRLAELGIRRAPFEEGSHILLVKSLALAGRFESANAQVASAEKMFVDELGKAPSTALRSAARRTIASPPIGVSPRAVVDSLMESGLAALSAGAADAGVDCLRRAAAEAESCADQPLQARALFELGSALIHSIRGFDDEGAILLRQAIELAQGSGDARIVATAYRELGYVDALAGRRPTAAAHLAKALEIAEHDDERAGVHGVIGFNLVDWGRLDEGLDHYRMSIEIARTAGNRRRETWSLGLGGWGLLAAGRLDEAERWLTESLELVDDLRWTAFRPWPQAVYCESRIRQRDRSDTIRGDLEGAFALSCQLGDPCWEGAVARALALWHEARDDHAVALQWLGEARKRCAREIDKYAALAVEILVDQARVADRLGQSALADACARESLSLAARWHMDAHVRRAVALITPSSKTS